MTADRQHRGQPRPGLRRAADGTLTPVGSFATGGRGGILAGSVVDHTA